jgi:hypothetical protein
MPNDPKIDIRPRSLYSYLILGAALFAFIQTFTLLSPILFSFLLISRLDQTFGLRTATATVQSLDSACGGEEEKAESNVFFPIEYMIHPMDSSRVFGYPRSGGKTNLRRKKGVILLVP